MKITLLVPKVSLGICLALSISVHPAYSFGLMKKITPRCSSYANQSAMMVRAISKEPILKWFH